VAADRAAVVVDAVLQGAGDTVEMGPQEVDQPGAEPMPPGAVAGERSGHRRQQQQPALGGELRRLDRLDVQPRQQGRRQGRLKVPPGLGHRAGLAVEQPETLLFLDRDVRDRRPERGAPQSVAQRQPRWRGGRIGAQPLEPEAGGPRRDVVARRGRGDGLLERAGAEAELGLGDGGDASAVWPGVAAADDEVGTVDRCPVHRRAERRQVERARQGEQASGLDRAPHVGRGDAGADQADRQARIRALRRPADEADDGVRRIRPELAVEQGEGEAVRGVAEPLDHFGRGRDPLDRLVVEPGIGFLDVERVAAVRAGDQDALSLPSYHRRLPPAVATISTARGVPPDPAQRPD